MKNKIILKTIFAVFLATIFLILSQIKFSQILGTKMKFSFAVLLGPTLLKIFGIRFGILIIILSQIFGQITNIFEFKEIKDIFLFFPIIFAGIFFTQSFKKEKRILVLPLLCLILFLLHPIGRQVWFYGLFWLIPFLLTFIKSQRLFIFNQSLAAAFVDHAVGSVIYLYLLNIPAQFWIQAIPLTIMERAFIGTGIAFCYILEIKILKILLKIPIFEKIKSLVFA